MTKLVTISLAAALLCAAAAPPALAQGFGNTGPGVGGQCSTVSGRQNLTGKTFTGTALWEDGESYNWRVTFNADCTATYGYNGQSYKNAVWSQNSERVIWDTNGGYAFYLGTLEPDGSIKGIMVNVRHGAGTFDFYPAR